MLGMTNKKYRTFANWLTINIKYSIYAMKMQNYFLKHL